MNERDDFSIEKNFRLYNNYVSVIFIQRLKNVKIDKTYYI